MRSRVTKTFCFEMAHALQGHKGPCKNIHGHSYRLSVTVIGITHPDTSQSHSGMVMDFTDLKTIVVDHVVRKFDHALVLNEKHAQVLFSENKSNPDKLIRVRYQPTCENLVAAFADEIRNRLPAAVNLHHLTLRETPSSYAEWYAEDNQ